MKKLSEGEKAPEFSGKDQNGNLISLKDFKGKKVVLYFYPKDNTPGCTSEACNIRDNYNMFISRGYAVIGVSSDSESSHQNFIKKYNLPFSLISDKEKIIIKDYGAWGKKKFMGREFEGILRTTLIIDEKGCVEKIINKVDTKNHTSQIFE